MRIYLAGVVAFADRKRGEDALRESEEKFRQLTENIQEVLWMTTPAMEGLLYASPAYENMVELQEAERKEPARELYDRIGQSLTALNINLSIMATALPLQASDELRAHQADSETLIESTTAAIGTFCVNCAHRCSMTTDSLPRALR